MPRADVRKLSYWESLNLGQRTLMLAAPALVVVVLVLGPPAVDLVARILMGLLILVAGVGGWRFGPQMKGQSVRNIGWAVCAGIGAGSFALSMAIGALELRDSNVITTRLGIAAVGMLASWAVVALGPNFTRGRW